MKTEIIYDEYIQTDQWQALAAETKRLAGNRCQVCNAGGELHAHHRTYARLGHELQSDLIALCANCHGLFHGKHDAQTGPSSWALVKSLTTELAKLRRETLLAGAVRQLEARGAL